MVGQSPNVLIHNGGVEHGGAGGGPGGIWRLLCCLVCVMCELGVVYTVGINFGDFLISDSKIAFLFLSSLFV